MRAAVAWFENGGAFDAAQWLADNAHLGEDQRIDAYRELGPAEQKAVSEHIDGLIRKATV
jgi:hypothetical protein